MMPTVNLYIDRMSKVEPVRVADVYAVTETNASQYTQAAAKIGLTSREYAEFREALTQDSAVYVRLPQRIDAMAGVHRNGRVYALRNVVVPSGTMGWTVNLSDGVQVIIPQICANLSMNRPRHVAAAPIPVRGSAGARRQVKRVAAAVYLRPLPVAIVETPVVFTPPADVVSILPAAPPAAALPVAASVVTHPVAVVPFLGLFAPVVAAFANHGGSAPSTPISAPPCSAGSNTMGVCRP